MQIFDYKNSSRFVKMPFAEMINPKEENLGMQERVLYIDKQFIYSTNIKDP